jgi:ABC-type multidrug transport system permease subunit
MRFVWICALKDIRRQLRDRATIVIWCGIPVLIATLMVMVFGGGELAPQAHVLIVDEDDSLVSGLLVGAFTQAGDMFLVESVDRQTGTERIDEGDASALLIIPQEFGQAVLDDTPVTLELVTNPAQRILPGMVQGVLEVLVDGAFYVQQVLGETLREMTGGLPEGARTFPGVQVAAWSISINSTVDRVLEVIDPPLIELETAVTERDEGEGFNFGLIMFPGILFMSLLFIAQGMSEDPWKEKEGGTLRRVMTTPRAIAGFLGGKIVAAGVFMLGIGCAGLIAGALFFGLEPARIPLAVAWGAVSGMTLMTMFVLLQLIASSQRGGSMLTNMVLFPLMFLGGSFFPFEAMPSGLAMVGKWTPNGWALVHFREILAGEATAGGLLTGLVGLTVVGGLLFLLSARRLRRRFATG